MISSLRWMKEVLSTPAQTLWLGSLDDDVRSAELAFRSYAQGARRLHTAKSPRGCENANAVIFASARAFVSAARRVELLLTTAPLKEFPAEVSSQIKQQRDAKRKFLSAFREVRNVSEHVADEVRQPHALVRQDQILLAPARGTWHPVLTLMTIEQSHLTAPHRGTAPITSTALSKLVDLRNQIVAVYVASLPRRNGEYLAVVPFDVLGWES